MPLAHPREPHPIADSGYSSIAARGFFGAFAALGGFGALTVLSLWGDTCRRGQSSAGGPSNPGRRRTPWSGSFRLGNGCTWSHGQFARRAEDYFQGDEIDSHGVDLLSQLAKILGGRIAAQ